MYSMILSAKVRFIQLESEYPKHFAKVFQDVLADFGSYQLRTTTKIKKLFKVQSEMLWLPRCLPRDPMIGRKFCLGLVVYIETSSSFKRNSRWSFGFSCQIILLVVSRLSFLDDLVRVES